MFKNIQKQLLLKHPLVWNLRIIPLATIAIALHIVFLILGYINGKLNFTETENDYTGNGADVTIVFFAVLISLLSIILWCVNYFKNNGLKSFYLKSNTSLFKEWLLIFIGFFFLSTFLVSYYYGKEVRVRDYYTLEEAQKRCKTLSQGSFFVDGSYSNNYYDGAEAAEAVAVDTAAVAVENVTDSVVPDKTKDYFIYNGKKYSYNSLMNKNLNSYSFFDFEKDSIHKEEVKTWLYNNDKKAIQNLFKNYLAIANEHKLKSSIDDNKWLNLIYDYPTFINYKTIGSEEKDYYYNNNDGSVIDTTECYIAFEKNEQYKYYKFYVPEKALQFNYSKIADAHNKPDIDSETLAIVLYISLALSLLLFSFRVTSGKSWLIALVSLGVLNILIGILSAIASSEYVYFTVVLSLIVGCFIYLLVKTNQNKGKGFTAVTNTILLWSLPAFGPIVYYFTLQISKAVSGYNEYAYAGRAIEFPKIEWLKDAGFVLLFINILFVVLVLLYLSKKLKQWRGIAES